jgi:hypothetical protein
MKLSNIVKPVAAAAVGAALVQQSAAAPTATTPSNALSARDVYIPEPTGSWPPSKCHKLGWAKTYCTTGSKAWDAAYTGLAFAGLFGAAAVVGGIYVAAKTECCGIGAAIGDGARSTQRRAGEVGDWISSHNPLGSSTSDAAVHTQPDRVSMPYFGAGEGDITFSTFNAGINAPRPTYAPAQSSSNGY